MFCNKCNHSLPEDSEFCQYCGNKIETLIQEIEVEEVFADETTETIEVVLPDLESEVPEVLDENAKIQIEGTVKNLNENKKEKQVKNRFCKFCGGKIDAQSKKCSGCGKQYFKGIKFNRSLTTVWILSAVIFTSIIINIVQFVKLENLTETVESQINTINWQRGKMDLLNKKNDDYDTICKELSSGTIGYASNNFRSSESIIVVDKDETDRKFTLTANWTKGGTVYPSYSGNSARVSFDTNTWTTSTKMTIEPECEGVTVVEFSNNVDSKTFKMIIIVTD